MSVTATRKVSGSGSVTQKARPASGGGSRGNSFVEAIDASNRVSVQSNLERDKKNKNQEDMTENEENRNILADKTYVESALEALYASGIYDEAGLDDAMNNMKNVGVYAQNYFTITGEKAAGNPQEGNEYDGFDEYQEYEADDEEENVSPYQDEKEDAQPAKDEGLGRLV